MAMNEDNVARHREALEAFNSHDLDSVLRSFADDITATDHAQQQTMKSKEAVRAWNQAWLDAYPDGEIEVIDCMGMGEWTVARFVGRGTNTGSLAGFAPTNRRTELHLCDLVRWDDDKIVEEHLYYDLYGLLSALGHIPPLGAPT